MYKQASAMITNIRNKSNYLKQALAIKFDGIITNKPKVKATDLDSFLESKGYLVVGESKNCTVSGPEALNARIPRGGQSISFQSMITNHKAFCWYQFGTDKHTHAIKLACQFFAYERHDQSYQAGDCPTTNAYIIISLYHQMAMAYSYRHNYNNTSIRASSKGTQAAIECFDYLAELAIHAHYAASEGLVIPLTKDDMIMALRKSEREGRNLEFYQVANELMTILAGMTHKARKY